MNWEDIIKRELLQGPAEASAYYHHNKPNIKEVEEGWEKFKEKQLRNLEDLKDGVMAVKGDLAHIVDDMQVSPENENKFKRLLRELATMVEKYANTLKVTSTDFLPPDFPASSVKDTLRINDRLRNLAEEDRAKAKKIRDRAER